MDHSDFDSVSWRNEPDSDISRPGTAESDAEDFQPTGQSINGKQRLSSATEGSQDEPLTDPAELGGLDGVLECTVDSPLKENDGTKDAYISYLVTTHVCCFFDLLVLSWF